MMDALLGRDVPGADGEPAGQPASRIVIVGEDAPAPAAPVAASAAARRWRPIAWADTVLAAFWDHPALFSLLAALAVLSGVWGFIEFYGPQYGRVPWYLWPFVPDSPLAVSAWLLAALAVKKGWEARGDAAGAAWAFFANWAAVWNAKVGIWTAFVLLHYSDVFFAGTRGHQVFQGMLLIAHLGMVALALLLFRKMRALSAVGYVGVLAVVFLWDFMDYFFIAIFMPETAIQVFPMGIPTEPERLRVTAFIAITLSVAATLALTLGMRMRGPPSPR